MIANGYFKGENILPAPGFKLSPSNSHSLVWELTILATFCPVTKGSQLSLGKKHDDQSWHPFLVLQSNFKGLCSIVKRIIKLDSILLPDETDFGFKGKREDNFLRFHNFLLMSYRLVKLQKKLIIIKEREPTWVFSFFGKTLDFEEVEICTTVEHIYFGSRLKNSWPTFKLRTLIYLFKFDLLCQHSSVDVPSRPGCLPRIKQKLAILT